MNSESGVTTKRHKLLAVLLNSLWRQRQDGPFSKVIEMHMSEQVAHLAAGICWVISPNEFKNLEAEIEKIIPTQGNEFLQSVASNLQSWVEEFKMGPGRQPHPYQRPAFEGKCSHHGDIQQAPQLDHSRRPSC